MAGFWNKHTKKYPPKRTETYEMKFTRTKSIRYDAVAVHQVFYLEKSNSGLYYKIPDMASTDGYSAKKPFDSLWLIDAVPFIVVWFYKPRRMKVFHKIHLLDFLNMRDRAIKKSFREEEIGCISQQIFIT